ncbi:hypothetical protein SPRG_05672 [Saprolegnia parasitica CBS 223.65]|uniref:Uncharacterized protein n=1 Tax=Saprolegnia parasitica (strain CBS 223.65) TaxID=695850 RepID=A0A067CQC9_SAPPC|nr:hypothetical protein SPRG_05672 [Saprolegnia parasitica CBS 223.65]KDO28711.1 hypothetical protein SPRG_05672 [Saprolegnia parasitica CBS 223.65]|eukprot:XP_012200351.1 hypothetical protein SPRG_05672 [Saprolegnia parasitica CBS 223.65]
MLNVSSLPLIAYISEPLPWQASYSSPERYANYSDFNAAFLALNQQLYSNSTLPVGSTFLVDKTNNVRVARALLTLHAQPMSLDECFSKSLLGLPGLVFYTSAIIENICAALNNVTSLREDAENACFHSRLFTYEYGRSCLWLVPGDAISARDWSYKIVLGDPTAIVLKDAWVASLYYLDIWINITNFGVATMQIQVSGNLSLVLQGVLYLARSVWFAYWGLCLVSFLLKRWKKQHAFSEVDPTLVAIAVTVYCPAFVLMLKHIETCARLYRRLFYYLVPTDLQSQESEAALVCIIYTLTTLSFPLAYGLAAGCVRRPRSIPADCSSVGFNGIKSAALFQASKALHIAPRRPARGGTIYHVMDLNPRLKLCPTINLRGTDCFVLCYYNGALTERLRLSLLSGVNFKRAAIPHSKAPSKYVVNELRATVSSVPKECSPVLHPKRSYEICMSPEPSVWSL